MFSVSAQAMHPKPSVNLGADFDQPKDSFKKWKKMLMKFKEITRETWTCIVLYLSFT